MKINDDNIKVTLYSNKFSKYGKDVDMIKVIFTHEFGDKIKNLRKYEYHSEEYDEHKFNLPIMTIHGTVKYGEKKTKDNITLNGIICIDIDKEDNPRLEEVGTLDDWKYELSNQDDLILVAKSCGGHGLMAIHRLANVTNDNFILYFNKLSKRYKEKWNINIDKSCSNINRLRYVTFDDEVVYNQIYNELTLSEEDYAIEKNYSKNNSNVKYTIDPDYIAFSGEGWYFGHSDRHIQNGVEVPLIKEMIHTQLAIFKNKEMVKKIWEQPGFYLNDAKSARILDWIDNWVEYDGTKIIPFEDYVPSVYVVNWMNTHLGYHFEIHTNKKCIEDEFICSDFISYKKEFTFNDKTDNYTGEIIDKEYLTSYIDTIKDKLSNLYMNMIECPPGRGKTTLVKQIYKNDNAKICLIEPYKSVIKNKFNDIDVNICVENKHIEKDMDFVITHYNHFNSAYLHNQLGDYDYIFIDESHLVGTQPFREDEMIKFANNIIKYNEEHQKTKIVLMTGTPTNESTMFGDNINVKFIFKENTFRDILLEYVVPQKLNIIKKQEELVYSQIDGIVNLANKANDENRKFFIYWGKGSVTNDTIISETIKKLNGLNIAIYHKRNDGNNDIDKINNEQQIGEYDGIISSCYFSVGCDLNDEEPIDIIIVGNNPWYEDIQTIGRIRKSLDVRVYVVVDSYVFNRVDSPYTMNNEYKRLDLINNAKNSRQTSLITKKSTDEELFIKTEIHTFDYINSDIITKCKKYDEYGITLLNGVNIDKDTYYLLPINGEQMIIDDVEITIKDVKEAYRHGISTIQDKIIHNLKCSNEDYDLDQFLDKAVKIPKLEDWLKGVIMIRKYYSIDKLLSYNNDIIKKVSKKQLNPIISWNIKYNSNDKVENEIIENCIKLKENKKWKKEYMPKAYILWVSQFDGDNNYEETAYDTIDDRLNYPVYKEWSNRLNTILSIDKPIRDIIIRKDEFKLDETTKLFFDIEDDNIEKTINISKNHLINKSDLIRFYNNIISPHKISAKRCKDLETGIVYNSSAECAKAIGKSKSYISKHKDRFIMQ